MEQNKVFAELIGTIIKNSVAKIHKLSSYSLSAFFLLFLGAAHAAPYIHQIGVCDFRYFPRTPQQVMDPHLISWKVQYEPDFADLGNRLSFEFSVKDIPYPLNPAPGRKPDFSYARRPVDNLGIEVNHDVDNKTYAYGLGNIEGRFLHDGFIVPHHGLLSPKQETLTAFRSARLQYKEADKNPGDQVWVLSYTYGGSDNKPKCGKVELICKVNNNIRLAYDKLPPGRPATTNPSGPPPTYEAGPPPAYEDVCPSAIQDQKD